MVYKQQDAHYCHVSVNEYSDDVMDKVMGYKGAYFKAFTEVMKLKYVWWNKETQVIELWGQFKKMKEAREAMVNRIEDVITASDDEPIDDTVTEPIASFSSSESECSTQDVHELEPLE
jgi:hypothetical protein